jgi:hypothetical protein
MLFMNEWEIDEAVHRHRGHPVLSRATRFLSEFRNEVNSHSDGWPYWPLPAHAAKQLMALIRHPETVDEDRFRVALAPIRSFYTRRGYAVGMKFPDVGQDLHKQPTLPFF